MIYYTRTKYLTLNNPEFELGDGWPTEQKPLLSSNARRPERDEGSLTNGKCGFPYQLPHHARRDACLQGQPTDYIHAPALRHCINTCVTLHSLQCISRSQNNVFACFKTRAQCKSTVIA